MANPVSKNNTVRGIHIGDVGRDVIVGGDIVAGNKTVIQNIIQQSAQKIITAPYKFLASYDISDWDIFFGRTAVIEELAGKIPRYKSLIINGESGSGKTSLINAGLIHRLTQNGYFFVTFRDYSDPIRQLHQYFTLHEEFRLHKADTLSLLEILHEVIRQQKSRLVIVLDQFERFFINVEPGTRARFIQEFKECMESDLSAEEMNFVFSVRQDYFGQLVSEFESSMPAFLNESARYHLKALNREEAREAIIKPLEHFPKISYDTDFVDKILLPGLIGKSAGSEQIDPPHIQIVCNRLFEAAQANLKKGRVVEINRDLYKKLGETQGILRDYMDHCVEQIVLKDLKNFNIVRSMLKLMIETTGTRKFISFKDILNGLPDIKDSELIKEFISRLQNARVVEIHGEGDATTYSLSHDVMVNKVQEWLDERETKRKQAYETLKRGLAEWKSSKTLLNKKQTRFLRKWIADLTEEDEKLLEDSEKAYRRCLLRLYGLIALFLAIAGLFIFKYSQKQKISNSRKLAAFAAQTLDTDPSLSFRLAEAALNVWPTLSAQKVILPPLEYPLHNVLEGHTDDVSSAAFSPNGRRIVTSSNDKTARVWDVGTSRQLYVLAGHEASISNVAFSKNGKLILTASFDKTARVWDTNTGRQLLVLEGHKDFVSCADFSPGANRIVTASWDKTARIWDAATGKQIHILEGHMDSVSSAKFSPDGKLIITASGDKTCRIWDAFSGRQLHVLQGHTASVMDIRFSGQGGLIASASYDNTARVWDASTGKPVSVMKGHIAPVVHAGFSPDSKKIITASKDNTAKVWDTATGREIHTLKGHAASIIYAEFSPSSDKIITASGDKTARIWDAETGQQIDILKGHTAPVTHAGFSPDSVLIVTSSKDNTARVWNTAAGMQINILKEQTDTLSVNTFSPDSRYIVTPSFNGTARVWDTLTGQEHHVLKGHADSVISAIFSPTGKYIVTASLDNTACIWEAATGRQIHILEGHSDSLTGASFSPDEKFIITSSYDETARIWDVDTGRERRLLDGHKGPVTSALFSPDGKQIATASWDKIRIFDAITGDEIRTLTGHKGLVMSAMFSPDGKLILTSSEEDLSVRVWDISSGLQALVLIGHTDLITGTVFSPDGKLIATSSWDKTARLWSVSKARAIHTLLGHTDIVTSVMFSPEGERVITASEDNTARIWDVDTGQQIHVLKGHTEGLECAVFSPDGKRATTTSSKDKTVRIWPGDYKEVLKFINTDSLRGKVRQLTTQEKIKYGVAKTE